MILTATHMFDLDQGRYSILAYGTTRFWVMERLWAFNRPYVSCVPKDEYRLVKHDSPKYPNTFALIGDGVSHGPEAGIPRFACVIHSARLPIELQGCLAPCMGVKHNGEAIDSSEATRALLKELNKGDEHTLLVQ